MGVFNSFLRTHSMITYNQSEELYTESSNTVLTTFPKIPSTVPSKLTERNSIFDASAGPSKITDRKSTINHNEIEDDE